MRVLLFLLLLVVPLGQVSIESPPLTRVTQVDASQYPDVTLYVQVAFADGRPMVGLQAGDFRVTEDGQPVTIGGFAGSGASAITTVLVLDHSGSMEDAGKMDGAREAAQVFVQQMRPGDRTAVVAFADEPEVIQPFTGDGVLLDSALRRLRANGATRLYDGLMMGVDLLRAVSGRRALVLLTDGRDCYQMPCDERASDATLDEVIAQAREAGVAVQVVGLGERGSADDRAGIDEGVLRRIADESGGGYFYTPSAGELVGLYGQLSADMQREYALTYRSPRPFYDGTRRDIAVVAAGMSAAGGGYVEQHFIQVQSSPVVGLMLLVPLVGALFLPVLLRRRGVGGQVSARGALMGVADGPTMVQRVVRCQVCDALLDGADAAFCVDCGASQVPPRADERVFCDQCGRAVRDGARFCSRCGAQTVGRSYRV